MPNTIHKKNVVSGQGTLYNKPIKIIPPPQGVEFGKYCSIAPNLKIMGINHDYNYPAVQNTFYKVLFNSNHPIDEKSKTYSKGRIVIGNDVWIGEDVYILSGVTVGDGCCIGCRSVITKDLPPYTICVGQPCKPVKLRYSKEMTDFLLRLKWWDWDEEKMKNNKEFFMTNLNAVQTSDLNKVIV
jgi:acetyltransferase-like isoleucine patch superfamily enzyme